MNDVDAATARPNRFPAATPSPGDVVATAEHIGRLTRLSRHGIATVQLDDSRTVLVDRSALTVVDRYRGPSANVQRCADGGWRFADIATLQWMPRVAA